MKKNAQNQIESEILLTSSERHWGRHNVSSNDTIVHNIGHCVKTMAKGRGGGQVVSILAFYYDDPSSNTAEVLFCEMCVLKRTKINKKSDQGWPIFRNMGKLRHLFISFRYFSQSNNLFESLDMRLQVVFCIS